MTSATQRLTAAIDDAMHAWLRSCGNPRAIEVLAATLAGLLTPAPVAAPHRYHATDKGRAWLVANAQRNGATRDEALRALNYIDGA